MHNGTPGETYDKWERALLNNGAKSDECGYSISDHFNGVDKGSAGVPHPAAAGSGTWIHRAPTDVNPDRHRENDKEMHMPC